jgi:hypothetical protein
LLHSSSESLIFIVHSITDVGKKYKRCKALVNKLKNVSITLNETNQKGLVSFIVERNLRVDVEDKLVEHLRAVVEEKIESVRKEHSVQIDEHAAQIGDQKRECKPYYTESKLNML